MQLDKSQRLYTRLTLGSPTGAQIYRLKNDLGRPDIQPDSRESLMVDYLDSSRQLAQLTDEERAVYTLRYQGDGHEVYERSTWSSDTHPVRYTPESLATMATMDGEEVIGAAKDEAGNRIEGRVVVRGKRTRLMSFGAIGAVLGITERQARRRYDSASQKMRPVR